MRPWIDAGPAKNVPPGGRKLVFIPGGETVLLLNVEGLFYALENSCPHAGASMASGPCQGHEITCPAHGLKFNVTNGRCTASPSLQIPMYAVREQDGHVWLGRETPGQD